MKKLQASALLILPLLLTGCGPSITNDDATLGKTSYNALTKGFKASGSLVVSTEYFEDEDYVIPSEEHKKTTDNFELILTYTNTHDYLGYDYKFYLNGPKNEKYLLINENMYSNKGYLYFNSVGYDNVVTNDVSANDSNGNFVPYSSNASLNPFTLVKASDFKKTNNGYSLDVVKSSLVFSDLLYSIMSIPLNINAKELNFVLNDNNELSKISGISQPYNDIQTIDLTNYYTRETYSIDFNISEIGTTDAEHEIKPEPEKPNNFPLKHAISNLANASSYRVNRHFKTPIDPAQETVELYFSMAEDAIYMQVWDRNEMFRPTTPLEADALLVDSKKDKDELLNAYMLAPSKNDETKLVFKPSKDLMSINNVFDYTSCLLNNLYTVSENIFDLNPDGSYSPIPEHLAFIANDLFVPFLCNTNEIAGGYVEAVNIYLTLDKKYIDYIDIVTYMGNIPGMTRITFDQLNNCTIPYNALEMIEE